MIRPDFDIVDRIRAYTGQRQLRREYVLREQALAYARELERIAAELQDVADEIRRTVA